MFKEKKLDGGLIFTMNLEKGANSLMVHVELRELPDGKHQMHDMYYQCTLYGQSADSVAGEILMSKHTQFSTLWEYEGAIPIMVEFLDPQFSKFTFTEEKRDEKRDITTPCKLFFEGRGQIVIQVMV